MTLRRILVANRGEIARRIFRTLRRLERTAIAVHSDADAEALFVREADEAHRIGPPPVSESYLDVDAILNAARDARADAVHPGYGLLSENADFADAVQRAGLVWIGPPADALRATGNKTEARARVRAAGVPTVPGSEGAVSASDAAEVAESVGYPLVVKAAGGGGGIGVELVKKPKQLSSVLERCAGRGGSAFGDTRVYLERFLEPVRHVEVQLLFDQTGGGIALGERECSLQRRYQKIVEETPSPGLQSLGELGATVRADMVEAALRAGRAVGYVNAGTVEFLVDTTPQGQGAFYFIEVNARLQVEHTITEAVTGLDLVEQQIRIAEGTPLGEEALETTPSGAAMQCRICAEEPRKRFIPSPGAITAYTEPSGPGVRVDSGIAAGSVVSPHYDSLLAKLVVAGVDRAEVLERMAAALSGFVLEGVATNVELCRAIMADATMQAGEVHTRWLEAFAKQWASG